MLIQDIAMLGLHAVFAVDRAGLVGEDGETHHGLFDVGFLRQIPGMQILCPASTAELKDMLRWAVKEYTGPVAVRYPRGGNGRYSDSDWKGLEKTVKCHRTGRDVTILTYGTLLNNVMDAAALLAEKGIEATVLRLQALSNIPVNDILAAMSENRPMVVVEETCSGSGIREAVAWELNQVHSDCRVCGIDLGHRFVTHGNTDTLHKYYGLDAESICAYVSGVINCEN
jgi:1-deoxy-D-xylulose-5-phosphate synthase